MTALVLIENDEDGEEIRLKLNTLMTERNERDAMRVRKFLFAFNSADTLRSLAHTSSDVVIGDLFETVWSDSNKIAGSGGLWEVTSLTAGTASDSLTVTSNSAVMQGTIAQFTFRPTTTFINPAQLAVNTAGGSLQQGRMHKARDYVLADYPNRRRLVGSGKITIGTGSSDGIDLKHACVDFTMLQVQENASGTDGYLLRVGDTSSGGQQSSASYVESKLLAQGINEGPNSTSGPGSTPGYDFQGSSSQAVNGKIPSTATGIFVENADSMENREFYVSRCKVGVKLSGNVEKQSFKIMATLCKTALEDYTVTGTPDTNIIEVTGNQCTTWFRSGDDSTGHIKFNCEARLCDGTFFPAAYNAAINIPTPGVLITTGKGYKISGEFRGNNGPNLIYVDRLSSTSLAGFGTDTFMCEDVTGIHTYGEFVTVDRVAYLGGNAISKDHGPGRLHYADTTSAIDSGAFRINRVEKSASSFTATVFDCYSKAGFWFGDTVKGLFSTGIVFGPISIGMRQVGTALAKTSVAGVFGMIIEKAVNCTFPIVQCNADIWLKPDCSGCVIEVPDHFVTLGCAFVIDSGATAKITVKGSLTAAQVSGITWAIAGTKIQSVSDRGGRPAVYDGTAWDLPADYATAL